MDLAVKGTIAEEKTKLMKSAAAAVTAFNYHYHHYLQLAG